MNTEQKSKNIFTYIQNFHLAFIDELEKKNYLLKKLLKWANKRCKNFNIYNVVFYFSKKIKKNT